VWFPISILIGLVVGWKLADYAIAHAWFKMTALLTAYVLFYIYYLMYLI
jgi:hypothetical protein